MLPLTRRACACAARGPHPARVQPPYSLQQLRLRRGNIQCTMLPDLAPDNTPGRLPTLDAAHMHLLPTLCPWSCNRGVWSHPCCKAGLVLHAMNTRVNPRRCGAARCGPYHCATRFNTAAPPALRVKLVILVSEQHHGSLLVMQQLKCPRATVGASGRHSLLQHVSLLGSPFRQPRRHL